MPYINAAPLNAFSKTRGHDGIFSGLLSSAHQFEGHRFLFLFLPVRTYLCKVLGKYFGVLGAFFTFLCLCRVIAALTMGYGFLGV